MFHSLIRPFFKQELQGLKDHVINQRIEVLSKKHFQTRKPLFFALIENCEAIITSRMGFIYQNNYPIIRAWASWEWLEYMQRCNSNVPAVANKLFPPQHREPLTAQRAYWKIVLKHTDVRYLF